MTNKPKCPKCEGKNIARLYYGEPPLTSGLIEQVLRKEIILMGHVVPRHPKEYKCLGCGYGFGMSEQFHTLVAAYESRSD